MFTITLQRDSVDIGENMGILLLGKLPAAVNNDSLTWVKARGYTTGDLYCIAWEVPVDDVWPDGQVSPWSSFSAANILCWDWLIPRVYLFTLLFLVYLLISISLSCCRVLRPTTADPSGGGMPSKCQSRHLDKKKNETVGIISWRSLDFSQRDFSFHFLYASGGQISISCQPYLFLD